MMKRYELLSEGTDWNGRNLHRIRALKTFEIAKGTTVSRGDIGGYVESERNLSQDGRAWIFSDAVCCDSAQISGNAVASGGVVVRDSATVSGDARIRDRVIISDDATVSGSVFACDQVEILGTAQVRGSAILCDYVTVHSATVEGASILSDRVLVCEGAVVSDEELCGDMIVRGK